MTESRKTAFEVLLRCEKDMVYSGLALAGALSKSGMSVVDKALTGELVYGTLERLLTLDFFISRLSERPLLKLDKKILLILRMALYQILYLDRVPDRSACDEAVELAKLVGPQSATGFVNAILRTFLRRRVELQALLSNSGDLAAIYSISPSVIELWTNVYGQLKTVEILEGMNRRRGITLSVNTLRVTPQALAQTLGGSTSDFDTVKIPRQGDIESLPGFAEGYFFVQDIVSAKAVSLLQPKAGETLFDVCAAPGGKSLKAAILMGDSGRVVSRDIHAKKLNLISHSARRLGLKSIECQTADAAKEDSASAGMADKVICDVPCSGLGVMAKKPEIRYKDTKDFEKLPQVQENILRSSAKLVKRGGRLLYSTCTVSPYENEQVVRKFLESTEEYTLDYEEQMLPSSDNDGFYLAILARNQL